MHPVRPPLLLALLSSLTLALLTLSSPPAQAQAKPAAQARPEGRSEITGRLSGKNPSPGVVWIEGVAPGSFAVPKETLTLSQRGARFHPTFLVVVAGQKVRLPNDDKIVHNVFSVSPVRRFDLGHYRPGESQTVTFDRPGVVDLFCNIHENMHAVVVVVPSTFFATVNPDGTYRLTGVAAGTYQLHAQAGDGEQARTQVTVDGTSALKQDLQLQPKR